MNLASSSIDAVSHYVWWMQFLVGFGLLLGAAALSWLEDRTDIGLFGVAGFIVGIAGLIVTWNAVF